MIGIENKIEVEIEVEKEGWRDFNENTQFQVRCNFDPFLTIVIKNIS